LWRLPVWLSVGSTLVLSGVIVTGTALGAITVDLNRVAAVHGTSLKHTFQSQFFDLVQAGRQAEAFDLAFERGDELFDTSFFASDGGGANVGNGQRFTRVPRADLKAAGQWAAHTPSRATGPNSGKCADCHGPPGDGASGAMGNVHRDPEHSGVLARFIQRNTPHLFAPGAIQRLAEEMTDDLQETRVDAAKDACDQRNSVTRTLSSKGVSFGSIKAIPNEGRSGCTATFDTSSVLGVGADLVVRPFQWKGSVATIREFNRDAAHQELGMQAVETTGDNVDGDSDGVTNELFVGDITALTVYIAAQPRPTTRIELARLGLDSLTSAETDSINRGEALFTSSSRTGCATCHTPQMTVDNVIFSEPSQNKNFRESKFPAGQDTVDRKLDPRFPVTFDMTRDPPDNRIVVDSAGNLLGSIKRDGRGNGVVGLFGDLKRHDIGPDLAEGIDEVRTGPSVFLTENLWGVGTTAPYMHDGRATTLTEAILLHGGEATAARSNFLRLNTNEQKDLIAFLNNLVLFFQEKE
jgi:mono/diheme cytochrome c family protein